MLLSTKSARAAAVAVVASLALAACGGGATPSPSASSPASVDPSGPASQEPSAEPGALPTPEKTTLNVGVSVTEMSQFAGILAAEAGIYEKHGLTVEYSVFEGDARVAQALQAGQIDIGFSGTSSAISSQLTDTPYDVVAVNAIILTDDLVCKDGINNAETIKARPADGEKATIAISTFGGTSNAAALLALKALGLSPTDAVITQVGGQSARLAALQGGSIDCAIIDSNLEQEMIDQGFEIAVNLKDAQIPFGRSGMSLLQDFIAANPNTTLVAVASVLEAQNMIFAEPDKVVPIYAEFTGLEEAEAKAQVENFVGIGNRSLQWTEEALVNAQKAIAVVNPDIIDVSVADAGNPTFLQTLVDNGFYELIGSPVP